MDMVLERTATVPRVIPQAACPAMSRRLVIRGVRLLKGPRDLWRKTGMAPSLLGTVAFRSKSAPNHKRRLAQGSDDEPRNDDAIECH